MKFELGTLKRGAMALAFGVALLVGAGVTANAQHGSYNGGYQNNSHVQRDVQHERRDDRRVLNHQQRDNRGYNNNGYYNDNGYYNNGYNNNGYYNNGYNNNNGYYNNSHSYNNGYYNQRDRHHGNVGLGIIRRDRHHR